jgi:hypothetical protein
MDETPRNQKQAVDGATPPEAVPMIGDYVINYDALTREGIEARCPETEALLARSILISESREIKAPPDGTGPGSHAMAIAASLTLPVALSTNAAERAISLMLSLMRVTLSDAVCMLDDISRVTADCSSTAAEIDTEMSLRRETVSVMAPMASTT